MKDLFFINEDILKFEKVIVYGSSNAGRSMLFKLLQHNIRVECFADSDPERCGARLLNIPIVHIDELVPIRQTAAIIVSGIYAFTVAEELEKRGFSNIFMDFGNDQGLVHLERNE